MQAAYDGPLGRKAFVRLHLAEHPACQIQWENCAGQSVDVHEWWARGMGGAIVPGDKATRQEQRFIAICRRCHGDLDLDLPRARREGWVR